MAMLEIANRDTLKSWEQACQHLRYQGGLFIDFRVAEQYYLPLRYHEILGSQGQYLRARRGTAIDSRAFEETACH